MFSIDMTQQYFAGLGLARFVISPSAQMAVGGKIGFDRNAHPMRARLNDF